MKCIVKTVASTEKQKRNRTVNLLHQEVKSKSVKESKSWFGIILDKIYKMYFEKIQRDWKGKIGFVLQPRLFDYWQK